MALSYSGFYTAFSICYIDCVLHYRRRPSGTFESGGCLKYLRRVK
jgi:hypothetical protein